MLEHMRNYAVKCENYGEKIATLQILKSEGEDVFIPDIQSSGLSMDYPYIQYKQDKVWMGYSGPATLKSVISFIEFMSLFNEKLVEFECEDKKVTVDSKNFTVDGNTYPNTMIDQLVEARKKVKQNNA